MNVQKPLFTAKQLWFGILLLLFISRGGVQVLVGKELAYIICIFPFCLLLIYEIFKNKLKPTRLDLGLWLALVVCCFISGVLTVAHGSSLIVPVFYGIYLAIIFWFFMLARQCQDFVQSYFNVWILLVVALIMAAVGLAQYFGYGLIFPGCLYAYGQIGAIAPRACALTGSALHYALMLALFFGIMFQATLLKPNKWKVLFAFILFYMCFLSLTRSAMLIISVAILWNLIFQSSKKYVLLVVGFLVVLILVSSLQSFSLWHKSNITPIPAQKVHHASAAVGLINHNIILHQYRSSGNLQQAGNATRVDIWRNAVTEFMDSPPYVFGIHLGQIGNLTPNFHLKENTQVAESSGLELLLSVGVFGTIIVAIILLRTLCAIPRECAFMQGIFAGALVEMWTYQSIEVIPFMLLLALYPAIAKYLQKQYQQERLA